MVDLATLLVNATGNPFIVAIVLGMLPISEVRGAAIYAFSIEQPWLVLPAAFANIAVALLILLFWNAINIPFWGRLILGHRLENRLLKIGKRYEAQGLIAIALFIGAPLPFTGVYTGTLIAEFLGIKRSHTLIAAVVGVGIATAAMLVLLGGLKMALSSFGTKLS